VKHHMSVLGIDIAKRVFHVVGMNERGQIVLRKRMSRHDLLPCIATLPPVLIGMEACGGAHDWARRFREHGHEVKLMSPQFVKPYVKSNKNDMRDAEGIGEAVPRPPRRFVPTQDVEPHDIQALHRVRERLRGARTALVNEIHGLLHEYGIVVPKGVSKFARPSSASSRPKRTNSRRSAKRCFGSSWTSLLCWRSSWPLIKRNWKPWPRHILSVDA
jgi:transposase